MTLHEYLKVLRHRWRIIVLCALVAAAVVWVVSPAETQTTQKVGSYTATATLVVGADGGDDTAAPSPSALARIALYVTTGEIPRLAAESLGYAGDPAVLTSGLTVVQDPVAGALTISTSASDGTRAAAVANAFATESVGFFEARRTGVGNVSVSILQEATPIPNQAGGGFVVPPDRRVRAAIASVLGLLLGLALALVLHHIDSRLRTRDEVHEALRMPIIAEVPKLRRAQRGRGQISVVEEPLGGAANGYRAARTALVHMPSHRVPGEWTSPRAAGTAEHDIPIAPRVVLISSAHPGEGKTTSVANLAASFAEAGQRVLVLDGDLRSPDTHNIFDLPQGPGISDYLSAGGNLSVDSLARNTSLPGVQLITAGTCLDRPTSLASQMGPLLAASRELADVVLIDSAPLLAASDVFDVLPMVDTVMLVVRSGRLTKAAGGRVAELLGRFQVPVIGAVLIATQASREDGYGYGYGYGSRSGYGEPKKQLFGRRRGNNAASSTSGSSDSDDSALSSESRRARRTSSSSA